MEKLSLVKKPSIPRRSRVNKTIKQLETALKRRKQESMVMYQYIYDNCGTTTREMKDLINKELGTRESPKVLDLENV